EVVSGVSAAVEGDDLKPELEEHIENLLALAADDIELDAIAGFLDEKKRARLRRVRVATVSAAEAVQLAEGRGWVEVDVSGEVTLDITTRIEDFAQRHEAIQAFERGTEPGEWSWDEERPFEAHGSLIVDPSTRVISEAGIDMVKIDGTKFRVDQGITGP